MVPRLLPLALTLLLAGCRKPDPPTYPVEGTVTFAGQPANGYAVEFASQSGESKGYNATGQVGPDGRFTLTTMMNGKEKPGAVAGPHKVVVVAPPSGKGPAVIVPIPPRFEDYATSGLTFEVKPAEPNVYKLALER